MIQINFREAEKILKNNGYTYERTRGSHFQYVKDGKRIVITRKKVNPCVWARLVKEYNLVIS